MRKAFTLLASLSLLGVVLVQATSASGAGIRVSADSRVTGQRYVRHDGGTDDAIAICNSEAPPTTGTTR